MSRRLLIVTYEWTGIPSQLIGSDYVQMANDNADVHPFAVDVTVVEGTILHLIIPEHEHLLPFAWMSESVFGASWVNTGAVITSSWSSACSNLEYRPATRRNLSFR